jgi:uncharacterized protein GlcG (DUF336 family)
MGGAPFFCPDDGAERAFRHVRGGELPACVGRSVDHRRKEIRIMQSLNSLSLADARTIIDAGIAEAESIGNPMNIAVVDVSGQLIAFVRMDGAWLGSVDIAINKAWTARAFDIETKALAKASQPGDDFYGIQNSNAGKVMIFAGGVPIKQGDAVIGAVGVSGGTGKQDQGVAEAAAKGFG